jgi:hypothetical protein
MQEPLTMSLPLPHLQTRCLRLATVIHSRFPSRDSLYDAATILLLAAHQVRDDLAAREPDEAYGAAWTAVNEAKLVAGWLRDAGQLAPNAEVHEALRRMHREVITALLLAQRHDPGADG